VTGISTEWVGDRLARWARDCYGLDATVADVAPMPGNSGISFGVTVVSARGVERLVVRMPHPQASRQGSSDVLRQVAVLRAAVEAGIPVPRVVWAADENPWFGVPYYAVSFVAGTSTHLFDPDRASECDGTGLAGVFADAMAVLARLRRIDWAGRLPGWTPRTLECEIDAWVPTLRKSSNQRWVDAGLRVRDLLLASVPRGERALGVVHGDYYSNNWLFAEGRVRAVVDWEIASVGDPGLDVGWLCMIYDPASWAPSRHWWSAWTPDPDELVTAYEEAGGAALQDIGFYRALAGYRMGCIAARAHELRVAGKIDDPAWDVVGPSYPMMMERARELLSRGR
jgi:aminoglycoside phosphotransferase (APT) family kinase protein